MKALEEVVAAVRRAGPDLVDRWEITALIEASGYSDARIQEELQHPDSRALAEVVYERLRAEARPLVTPPPRTSRIRAVGNACTAFVSDFTGSIVYAVPWLVMFWMQHLRPDAFAVPASVTAPLMLALMASLVATAGIVQAIVRKGVFYTSMEQPAVAYRVTRKLFELGAIAASVVGVAAAAAALYFEMFPASVLLVALSSYVTLSLLWMMCALITIDGRRWRVPAVFAAGATAFVALYNTGAGTVASQLGASYTSLLYGALFAAADRARAGEPPASFLPKARVLVHSLAPYMWYGTLYFSLLFADRLVAGTARLLDGESFGVDAPYAQATEVALVSFLLMAAVVEYLNSVFMRFFRREVARRPSDDPALARIVARRHVLLLLTVVILFPIVDVICRSLSVSLRPLAQDPEGWRVLVLASAGYLCLATGLLNSLILLSVNRPFAVVSSFAAALVVDVVVGTGSAALLGAPYAAFGLTAGAAWLAVRTTTRVSTALAAPAHTYAAL
jgi:hypothetical protein